MIALDMQATVYRAGHGQRWEIVASLPLDVSTTSPVANGASSRRSSR